MSSSSSRSSTSSKASSSSASSSASSSSSSSSSSSAAPSSEATSSSAPRIDEDAAQQTHSDAFVPAAEPSSGYSGSGGAADNKRINITGTAVQLELAWSGVVYKVPLVSRPKRLLGRFQSGSDESNFKTILHGLSGVAGPGEFVAVMGSSGAGKSTLLDILAARIRKSSNLRGQFRINGEPREKFSQFVAYVQQQDALYPLHTVRESLLYSARLRLPGVRDKEKRRRVEEVIEQLGLRKVAKSLIGGSASTPVRGISGGERRRVSIGMELVCEPSILFLDEPTSGLDSYSAELVVSLLRDLARGGKTIVMTIHQPAASLYAMFDKVIFLADGREVYSGSAKNTLNYFSAIGQPAPANVNAAEHVLETVNVMQRQGKLSTLHEEWAARRDQWVDPRVLSSLRALESSIAAQHDRDAGAEGASAGDAELIAMENGASAAASNTSAPRDGGELDNPPPMVAQSKKKSLAKLVQSKNVKKRRTNMLLEFVWLWWRATKNSVRSPSFFWFRLISQIFVALIIGTVFLGSARRNLIDAHREVMSFFAFTLATIYFPSLDNLPSWFDEQELLKRERGSKYHRLIPFVFAQTVNMIPWLFMVAAMYTCTSYFLVGLDADPGKFFYMILILFLVYMIGFSYALLVGVLAPSQITANGTGTAFLAILFLFSGFFIPRSDIPDYWIWLHYLSLFKWALEPLMANQYHDLSSPSTIYQPRCRDLIANSAAQLNVTVDQYVSSGNASSLGCFFPSEDFPKEIYDVQLLNRGAYVAILIFITILLRFIFYIVLRCKKPRRK